MVTGRDIYRGATSRSPRKHLREESMHRVARLDRDLCPLSVSVKNWRDRTCHTFHTISSFFNISAFFFLYYLLQSKQNLHCKNFLQSWTFFFLFRTTTESLNLQVCYPAIYSRNTTTGEKQNKHPNKQTNPKRTTTKPNKHPPHNTTRIRCTLLTNKHIFYCSESFLLIDHVHSNPWWSSEFHQCS